MSKVVCVWLSVGLWTFVATGCDGERSNAIKRPVSAVPASPSHGSGGPIGTLATETIRIADRDRIYRLVVPESLNRDEAVPLVFAFHGAGDEPGAMSEYSRLDELAEREGFILVYPNAKKSFWFLELESAQDDLAFFDALYDRLAAEYNIDLNRVYLAGMSNGASFALLVANQRPDQIAAVAAHSGSLVKGMKPLTEAANRYAVLVIHGDVDTVIPIAEGRRMRDAYQDWGHTVEYLEIPGHDHSWATEENINAQIWEFFEANSRRIPLSPNPRVPPSPPPPIASSPHRLLPPSPPPRSQYARGFTRPCTRQGSPWILRKPSASVWS